MELPHLKLDILYETNRLGERAAISKYRVERYRPIAKENLTELFLSLSVGENPGKVEETHLLKAGVGVREDNKSRCKVGGQISVVPGPVPGPGPSIGSGPPAQGPHGLHLDMGPFFSSDFSDSFEEFTFFYIFLVFWAWSHAVGGGGRVVGGSLGEAR